MSLTPLARQALALNPEAYRSLLVEGPGSSEAATLLQSSTLDALFSSPIAQAEEAQCVLAALWLWHDHLGPSHRIVQNVQTNSGSFWHAIVHRREGDFSNSRYWYARAAGHPVLAESDSIALIDRVARGAAGDLQTIEMQRREWRILFDFCVRAATIPAGLT